jgi:hypothetical protein
MKIESITQSSGSCEIETTGSFYTLGSNTITLSQAIDPSTVGSTRRVVSKIYLESSNNWSVTDAPSSGEYCILRSANWKLEVRNDSLAKLTNISGITKQYTYRNDVSSAAWNRGSGTSERMWADQTGGTLHAENPNAAGLSLVTSDTDNVVATLPNGAGIVTSVFPPRTYGYSTIYEECPHIMFALSASFATLTSELDSYKADDKVSTVMIDSRHYTGGSSIPVLQPSGLYGYTWADEPGVTSLISELHSRDMKLMAYCIPYRFGEFQSYADTKEFLTGFINEWSIDGMYLDSCAFGFTNWMESYEGMRDFRKTVGDDFPLYLHASFDIWEQYDWDGKTMVPADTYADFRLTGENGDLANYVENVDDEYIRYRTCGHGLTSCVPSYKIATDGTATISTEELYRLFGEEFHGEYRLSRGIRSDWQTKYRPLWTTSRNSYLTNPSANTGVIWPVSWYNGITDVSVTPGSTTATVTWTTAVASDSDVRYGIDGIDSLRDDDGSVSRQQDASMVTSHSIPLTGLTPSTTYRIAVRSVSADTTIYGEETTFTTTA